MKLKKLIIIAVGIAVTMQSFAAYKMGSNKSSRPDGYINHHGYVDLGLPSGLKWATCNVGASSPSDYGNYYAWGETTTKSSYDETNSLTYGKDMSALQAAGIIGALGCLTMQYDAARANWGGNWRMPTKEECEELERVCKWTWAIQGGHKGYKITGPNGHSIFLPAAGWREESSLSFAGDYGFLWSSTPDESNTQRAFSPNFSRSSYYVGGDNRDNGRSVRPVIE